MSVNFLQYIKPVHYFSQLFGISFFSLPDYETNDCGGEIFNFIISLPVVSIYLYCSFHTLYYMTELQSSNRNSSPNFMKILTVIYISQFVLNCLYNIVYKNRIKTVLYSLHESITINYDKKRAIVIIKIISILCLFTVLFFYDLNALLTEGTSYIVIRFGVYLNVFTVFQHVIIMTEIKNQFANINDNLLAFKISANNKYANINEKQRRFSRLTHLTKSHQMLSEVAKLFSDTLGIRMLTQIAFYFVLLVFSTSPMIRIWKNKDKDLADWEWLVVAVVWCSIFMAGIVSICYTYNAVMQEERKASLIVHEFWNEHVQEYSIFRIDEFQSISLQMLHGKLRFTAWGFFDLNFTLLHTVVAAMATYMVILNQFDDMSK